MHINNVYKEAIEAQTILSYDIWPKNATPMLALKPLCTFNSPWMESTLVKALQWKQALPKCIQRLRAEKGSDEKAQKVVLHMDSSKIGKVMTFTFAIKENNGVGKQKNICLKTQRKLFEEGVL